MLAPPRSRRGSDYRLARGRRLLGVALLLCLPALIGCHGAELLGPLQIPEAQLPAYYHVELDPQLHTPSVVSNDHLVGAAQPGAPGAFTDEQAFGIVHEFVTHHAPVFHFRPGLDDFRKLNATSLDGLNFVGVQQLYRGLPVGGFGYGATVLPSGEVGSMIGRFLADVRVPVTPTVDAAVAADSALAAVRPLSAAPVAVVGTPSLMVLPGDDYPRLAWTVLVDSAPTFGSWMVYVDARHGGVLHVVSTVIVG